MTILFAKHSYSFPFCSKALETHAYNHLDSQRGTFALKGVSIKEYGSYLIWHIEFQAVEYYLKFQW